MVRQVRMQRREVQFRAPFRSRADPLPFSPSVGRNLHLLVTMTPQPEFLNAQVRLLRRDGKLVTA